MWLGRHACGGSQDLLEAEGADREAREQAAGGGRCSAGCRQGSQECAECDHREELVRSNTDEDK